MHVPSMHDWKSSHTKKHIPQFSESHCVLVHTPSQNSSPGSVHSPPVVICVVPVSLSPVVPSVLLVDESLDDELELDSEEDDEDEVVSEVDGVSEVEVESAVEVESGGAVDDELVGSDVVVGSTIVGMVLVLDIESIPVVSIDPLVAVVSSPGSPPLQANRARPTSVEITIGAVPGTLASAAEQNGQRGSLSQT